MSAFTNRFDYCPWLFWRQADSEQRGAQLAHQADLIASGIVVFGEHCFVSPLAGLVPARLSLGDRAYIAAHAYVTGDVAIGADSTVNPFATVRGKVSLGNGVRIGAHASVLGFNHRSDDLLRPIHTQGLETRGIVVDDDVWIGSGALLLDGVRVGSHSIVAAGAVVTKDVPAYAVVAGNPARVLRDRRAARVSRRPGVEAPTLTPDPAMPPSHPSQSAHVLSASPWLASASSAPVRATQAADVAATLHAFGRRVAAQWPEVLARCEATVNGERRFVDAPGQRPRMFRPNCDAIEIAAAFGAPPPLMQADRWIEVLQATQDAASGLPIDPWRPNHPAAPLARLGDGHTRYQILAIGHALECLGAHLAQPIRAVHDMPPDQLVALLNRLPWREHAWQCGAWVDSFATGLWMNRRDFGLEGPIATLFDWLRGACRPNTGLWGESADGRDWLQPVNGFYRLTRGSYAQFDLRVPYPESTVDTVLAHIRLNDGFIERRVDACNLLDTIHPLWLMLQHTEHRRAEALRYIEAQIGRICARWQDGRGFGFAPQDEPGLKGTEMGLAIVHIAADALGLAHELPYRPRGVHRLRN